MMKTTNAQKRILFMAGILLLAAIAVWAQGRGQGGRNAGPTLWTAWTQIKYWTFIGVAVIGTILLATRKMSWTVRFFTMLAAFFIFGVLAVLPLGEWVHLFGLHPSPMCVIEKPFIFYNARGVAPIFFVSVFSVIAVISVISNKSFCAHVCPIGAMQELIYRIPLPKFKLPFMLTNAIRFGLFVLFVILLFAAGVSLYNYLNAFHILHWEWEWLLIPGIIIAVFGALFMYRPFCYLVCPIGLFTWVLEQVSIVRVKVDMEICNDCQKCVEKAPCTAVPAILEKKRLRPDCFGCGVCLNQCEGGLKFKA